MQARLKVVQDNANLKQVKLLPITVIGRGADCHLKIASTQVSRKHCRITVTESEVLVEDLTSSNGTFVNLEKIPSGKQVAVAPGAKLQVGPATFIVDYTPPVSLENMPTTVIKASELPALNELAMTKPTPTSEASIPTIDPFAAAVAEGSAPAGVITPNPAAEVPLPAAPGNFDLEQTVHVETPARDAKQEEISIETVGVAESISAADSTIAPQPPVVAPQVVAPAPPVAAPIAPPKIEAPVINVVEQPALVPAAIVSAPPLVTAPIAPPALAVAAPVPVAVVPAAAVVPVPVTSPPPVAAPAREFDFLGGAATAAAEPQAFNAFEFDLAVPAPAAASAPSESTAKPAAPKKALFGLFGKKEKAAAPPAAPAAEAPAPAAPVAPPAPTIAPVAPPAAEPAAAPPSDDPFAFLR